MNAVGNDNVYIYIYIYIYTGDNGSDNRTANDNIKNT